VGCSVGRGRLLRLASAPLQRRLPLGPFLMPVELWLECVLEDGLIGKTCLRGSEDRFVLKAVGNCQALGGWNPAGGAPLKAYRAVPSAGSSTPSGCSPTTFRALLRLAEHPEELPMWLEYKYVLAERGSGAVMWEEDLGEYEPLPRFCGLDGCDESLPVKKLKLSRRLQPPRSHALLMRQDRCGPSPRADLGTARLQAVWWVPAAWDPKVAGAVACVGPLLRPMGTLPPPLPEGPEEARSALARLLFVHPHRSRLLGCLTQLVRRRRLPGHLWLHIWGFIDVSSGCGGF